MDRNIVAFCQTLYYFTENETVNGTGLCVLKRFLKLIKPWRDTHKEAVIAESRANGGIEVIL